VRLAGMSGSARAAWRLTLAGRHGRPPWSDAGAVMAGGGAVRRDVKP
jgi:hypothetical protein